MLLNTESAARYKHYRQVKLEYCYIAKESWRLWIVLFDIKLSCYLSKASVLQDMLLGTFVCLFLYVIIDVQRVFSLNKPYIYITSLV
jgi:hypothetical protein